MHNLWNLQISFFKQRNLRIASTLNVSTVLPHNQTKILIHPG